MKSVHLCAAVVSSCLVSSWLVSPCLLAQQHAPDGHVVERLQSVTISPKPGAPFQATVVTDWTRTLADGTRITVKNSRTVARDSTGRVFQERRFLTADGDMTPAMISELDYIDPVRHERYVCVPARRICTAAEWYEQETESCSPRALQNLTVTCEALGTSSTDNIDTVGLREIVTRSGGPLGLKTPEPTITEFWYSQRLGLNLVVRRFDPRGGAQNFYFRRIDLKEPPPALFTLPEGFRIARTIIQ